MKTTIKLWYEEKYLPNKRCRKLRERAVSKDVDIEVCEVTKEEFPVAFVIHDYESVYEGAKSYSDFEGNGDYRMFSEEIRTYNGKLYKPLRVTYGTAISTNFETLDTLKYKLQEQAPYWKGGEDYSEESIIKESNFNEKMNSANKRAEVYIVCDGVIWETCGEPMYVINTFGLGHNHGGTGFFIEYFYNDNISAQNYFNALQREEAIAYGKKVALGRGDDKSVDGMGDHDIIEVKMPEMVKRCPQKDHGDGDPFLNGLESIISQSNSIGEAGLLTVLTTMAECNAEK